MLRIINPANEELIQEIAIDTPVSIEKKLRAARVAQRQWAKESLSNRIECLRNFRNLLEKDCEILAKTLTSELGKPISQSRNEINGTMSRLDFFLEKSPQAFQDVQVLNDSKNKMEERIAHEPLGVLANISAWNYPYFVGSNVFIPGLLAGNAILYKPSEFASLTGLAIAERLHKSGIPRDVFAPIIGNGSVGAELLEQRLDGIFFTGSYATGVKIAGSAAKQLIKVQLELGGKDPTYVCEDADPIAAAESLADGAFYNNGQSCCSVERIYVNASVYDRFIERFVQTVREFVIGDPLDSKTYIGPLTRQPQIKVIELQIQDAQRKGAKLLCGGKRLPGKKGYYFEPTVLVDVNHSMDVMREESFGPIIGIQKVQNDEEALDLMNDTQYGLTAGIYSKNADRAKALLSQVNAGSVYWNCCDRVSPRLPWSGRAHSGLGLTLGIQGILAFTQPKAWHLRGV